MLSRSGLPGVLVSAGGVTPARCPGRACGAPVLLLRLPVRRASPFAVRSRWSAVSRAGRATRVLIKPQSSQFVVTLAQKEPR